MQRQCLTRRRSGMVRTPLRSSCWNSTTSAPPAAAAAPAKPGTIGTAETPVSCAREGERFENEARYLARASEERRGEQIRAEERRVEEPAPIYQVFSIAPRPPRTWPDAAPRLTRPPSGRTIRRHRPFLDQQPFLRRRRWLRAGRCRAVWRAAGRTEWRSCTARRRGRPPLTRTPCTRFRSCQLSAPPPCVPPPSSGLAPAPP